MMRLGSLLLAFGLVTTPAFSMQTSSSAEKQVPGQKIVQALEHFRTGNYQEAVTFLSEIVRIEPRNIDARMLLGRSLIQLERLQEARIQFQAVLSLAPASIEAAERLQDADSGLRRFERKLADQRQLDAQTAQRLAEEEEQIAEATRQLANAERLIARGDLTGARSILEELKRTQPDMNIALQRLAEVYSAGKQFRKAAVQYRQLVDRSWDSDELLLRVAQNFEWAKAYPEAASAWRQILSKKPDNSLARRSLANIHFLTGRYSDSVEELQHILRENPQDIAALLSLAKAYEQLGDLAQEAASFEAVLKLEPHNSQAIDGRQRGIVKLNEKIRSDAFAALDARNLDRSAELFHQYLEANPDNTETLLQLARIYSWNARYPESRKYYSIYLDGVPSDPEARRELARIEEWTENYHAAIRHYQYLIELGVANITDYEGLIKVHRYMDDLAGAEIYAQTLDKLAPGNEVAASTHAEFLAREAALAAHKREAQRVADRAEADLASESGRFTEAIGLYRSYMDNYGHDRGIELTIARLFGWAEDFDRAAEEFRVYLKKYPSDLTAMLELSQIEEWSGHYDLAEKDYRRVLDEQPNNIDALLGVARVRDLRGDDPVHVLRSFQDVLSVDSTNEVALQRSSELTLVTSPQLTVSHRKFLDSDDLMRSRTSIANQITLPGRVRIVPEYDYGYFRQNRVFSPDTSALEDLNTKIVSVNGTVRAHGGSLGFEIGPPTWSLKAAIGKTRYSVGSQQWDAGLQTAFQNESWGRLALGFSRAAGIDDLNTVASLLAEVQTDRADVQFEHPLTELFHIATIAGVSRHSSNISPDFESTSRRAALYFNFSPGRNLSLGYAMRMTGFDRQSSIYFSPQMYQSHGLAYRVGRTFGDGSFISVAGEAAHGRIDGVESIEFNVAPQLGWQIGRTLQLQAGFSFGRSNTAVFGRDYESQSLEVQLRKTF